MWSCKKEKENHIDFTVISHCCHSQCRDMELHGMVGIWYDMGMAWHGRGMAWHVMVGVRHGMAWYDIAWVWHCMACHGRSMVWHGMLGLWHGMTW